MAAAIFFSLSLAAPAMADSSAPAPSSSPKADPAPQTDAPAKTDPAPKTDAPAPKTDAPAPKTDAPAPKTDATAKPETPSWETAPATRRAGFTLGVLLGGAAGDVSGYPNDVNKVGRPQFRSDTGAAFGGGATLFLGGALADWLVFGVGLSGAGVTGGGLLVRGFTFTLHTEVFPLFPLGGVWRELGVAIDTGAGNYTADLQDKPAGSLAGAPIDSGAASRFAVGLFYDGLRASKLSAGPYVGFDYAWSATMERPLLVVGLRGVLYAKAPKKR